MRRVRKKILDLVVLTSLCVFSSTIPALQVRSNIDAGLRYTDNATLVSSDEKEDIILDTSLYASVIKDSGPLYLDASTSVVFNDYTDNSFDNQYYPNMRATARWSQIEKRLTWTADNFFTQVGINNLDANTPDNTENTNAFSIGPEINFPVTARQDVKLNPYFRDFYYEESNTDNEHYGLSAAWLYQVYATNTVGLNGSFNQVKYDKSDLYPDYTSSSIFASYSGSGSMVDYSIDWGVTRVNRDGFDDQEGVAGSVDLLYTITGESSIRAFMSSDITDSSSSNYDSGVDPGTGDPANVQISGDVLRDGVIRLEYLKQDATLNVSVWSELRELDYKESPNDREVQEYGAVFSYPISSLMTAGLRGSYNETKETDTNRVDKNYAIDGDVGYRLSRKLSCNLNLRFREKDSTSSVNEYSEFSVFASIGYGLGRSGNGQYPGASVTSRQPASAFRW